MIPTANDTNILVSALRTPAGNEAAVLRAVQSRSILPCLSEPILTEYDRVLPKPKFEFAPSLVTAVIAQLAALGRHVAPPIDPGLSPHSDDSAFKACAIAARADFLVTGNRRHFPAQRYGTAEVVNARELLVRMTNPHR